MAEITIWKTRTRVPTEVVSCFNRVQDCSGSQPVRSVPGLPLIQEIQLLIQGRGGS